MNSTELTYEASSVICREGEVSSDLFFVKTGKILICTVNGTQVKAIARIGSGEFLGELSFFDGKTRSSYVIALEKCEIIQIPKQDLTKVLPFWYIQLGKNLTKKIRLLDHVLQESNLRRFDSEVQKPLSIDEQRRIFNIISKQ